MSNSINYTNNIIDAIQTIVDNAVKNAGYDRTLRATVSKCVDSTIGKYVIDYQDSSFYAYSTSTDVTYSDGAAVYVLVPANDLSQNKTILGTVDKLGTDYVSALETEEGYEVIGTNIVNPYNGFDLCSYSGGEIKTLYDKDQDINLIGLDTFSASTYLQDSNYILCGANFKTNLSSEQKLQGDYGLVFEINFLDSNTEEIITKNYIINIDRMSGNPYNFSKGSRQMSVFEIDGENFLDISKIYIFDRNFPRTEEGRPSDIFVSNIELNAAKELSLNEIQNCGLSLITQEGSYFDENDLDDAKLPIKAQIKVKGKAIDSDTQDAEYYWFIENNKVNRVHEKFNTYGGEGWECLNDFNIIDTEELTNPVVKWLSATYIYNVVKNKNVAKSTKYKCVAVYNGTVLSKEITIYNFSSQYDITIESDLGTQFYYDLGLPTLKCYINGEEDTEHYTYVWSSLDNNNEYSVIEETTTKNEEYNGAVTLKNTLIDKVKKEQMLSGKASLQIAECDDIINSYDTITRVEKNSIYHLKVNNIVSFTIFKCAVYKNEQYIGTAEITIYNDIRNTNDYTLVINEGNQVFKYNENGLAPDSDANANPQIILPLSFILYDDKGMRVDENAIALRDIEWTIPTKNTLLKADTAQGDPSFVEDDYATYSGLRQFNFNIATGYNAKYTNNEIELTVAYKEKVVTAKTNLVFTKQGEIGTNGTDFVCKIIPNTADGNINLDRHPTIYHNNALADITNYTLNYERPAGQEGKWFKVQLWQDGIKIFDGVGSGETLDGAPVEVTWSILKNNYARNITDSSNLRYDTTTNNFSIDGTLIDNPANMVKCSVKYKDMIYYDIMPMIFVNINNNKYTVDLDKDTGFRNVLYTTDGQLPSYDNNKPFTLIVRKLVDGIKEDISQLELSEHRVNYDWAVTGQTYRSEWQSELNLIYQKTKSEHGNRNEIYYYPIDTFDGLSVNNGLKCNVRELDSKTTNPVVTIYIPVYMYLNRYGNAALNEWDGNSISINEDDGIILAPQVGAGGKKEGENGFTGIFMGDVQEAGKKESEYGLYGYNNGERTIALSAEDGSARFGKTGSGQIVIDPSKGEALIESGNYSEEEDTGMRINLSEPSIEWANGNFLVDEKGRVFARELYMSPDDARTAKEQLDEIENAVPKFIVEPESTTLSIPTNSERYPLETKNDYKIAVSTKFKGEEVTGTNCSFVYEPTLNPGVQASWNITTKEISFSVNKNTKLGGNIVKIIGEFSYQEPKSKVTYSVKKQFTISVSLQGESGSSPYFSYLTNENTTFPYGTEKTIQTQLYGYHGTIEKTVKIISINEKTAKLTDTDLGIKGMKFNVSSTSSVSHPTITFKSDTTLEQGVSAQIPIVYEVDNKTETQYTTYFSIATTVQGDPGANAQLITINSTGQVFSKTKDSTVYTPSQIELVPSTQGPDIAYKEWKYSSDGGSTWTLLTNAEIGVDIDVNGKVTIGNNSSFVTSDIMSYAFRCYSTIDSIYDTVTIIKVKDGADGYTPIKGKDYFDGTGVTVVSSVAKYMTSNSGTTVPTETATKKWDTNIPQTSKEEPYLWCRNTITYSDNTTAISYGVSSTMDSISETLDDLESFKTTATQDIEDLQKQVDGAIMAWFDNYVPTLTNKPANEWDTTAKKDEHLGDLFYIVNNAEKGGQCYRFAKINNVYQWVIVEDVDVAKALADASKAQATADGKRTVFTQNPTTITDSSYQLGDLYTDGKDLYVCIKEKTKEQVKVFNEDWQKATEYTDDTLAQTALDEAKKAKTLTVLLSNETHNIPTDKDGNNPDYTGASTKVQVFYGSEDVTTSATHTRTTSNVSGTWSSTNHTYTITSITADSGYVDLTVSYQTEKSGVLTATARFSVIKVKAGQSGEDARIVSIAATNQIFKKNKNTTAYTPTSITLTPSFQYCSLGNWQYYNTSNSTWTNITSTTTSTTAAYRSGNNLIIPSGINYNSNANSVTFRCVDNSNTAYDIITIAKVSDGDNGISTRILSKEIKYGYNNSGTDYSTVPSSRSTENPGGWGTTLPTVPDGKYLWTRTTVQYTEDGTTKSDETVSYTVSYQAEDAIQYYTYIRYANSSTPKDADIKIDPTGQKYLGVSVTTSDSAPTTSSSYTWSKFAGEDGENGFSTWTTTTAPSSNKIKITALSGPTGATPRVGEAVIRSNRYWYTITAVDSTDITVGTATDLKGTQGTAATNVICGNETQSIVCDKDGLVSGDQVITIPFAGYSGTARKECTVTYSTLPSGITLTSNTAATTSADGSLILAVASGSNLGNTATGTINLTFVCNSITIVKTFTWSKAIAGQDGTDGIDGTSPYGLILTNEAQTIAGTNTNGTKYAVAGTFSTKVIGYKGTAQQSTSVTGSSITGLPTGMTAAVTNNSSTNTTITFTIAANKMTSSGGTITIPITMDGASFTKTISYSVSYEGEKGLPGDAATTYDIEPSVYSIIRNMDNSLTPATFTVTAYSTDAKDNVKSLYAGRWYVESTTNGTTWNRVFGSTADKSTPAAFTPDSTWKLIRVSLYPAGTSCSSKPTIAPLDTQTISIIADSEIDFKVGGTNIVSNNVKNWQPGHWSNTDGSYVPNYNGRICSINGYTVEPGETYYIKLYYGDPSFNNRMLLFRYYDIDGNFINSVIGMTDQKWTCPSNAVEIRLALYDNITLSDLEDGKVKIKVEKGNIPTDWSPSLEDTDADIATAKYITVIEYHKGTKDTQPSSTSKDWSTAIPPVHTQLASETATGVWSRIRYIYEDGRDSTYSDIHFSPTSAIILKRTETEYVLLDTAESPEGTLPEGRSWKPVPAGQIEPEEKYPYLWIREKKTYGYSDLDAEQEWSEYGEPELDQNWNQFLSFQSSILGDVSSILNVVGKDAKGVCRMNDKYIAIGDEAENPKHILLITHAGICFFDNADKAGQGQSWPDPEVLGDYATSTWSVDGTFNAQRITVVGLEAQSIANEVLNLGKNRTKGGNSTGALRIYDRYDNLIFETVGDSTIEETRSEDGTVTYNNKSNYIYGFKIYKYIKPTSGGVLQDNGYIYLSKDGFGEYDSSGALIYGTKSGKFYAKQQETEHLDIKTQVSNTTVGIQIVPMYTSTTGDSKTHKGIGFVKL